MNSENIDVSFIILSYNDADMVIRAVHSIKKLKTNYKYDIFVADNGSKEGTVEKINKEHSDINVVRHKENVGTAGYDIAVKQSKAKYIFFTGCDIEVKHDMLDPLVDFLEKNEKVVQAAPKYVDFANRDQIDMAGTWLSKSFYSGKFKTNELGGKTVAIPYIGTGLIRRSFVDEWGYIFDNNFFFYGEDVDLGMRIWLSGYETHYLPSSIVFHVGSISRNVHRPAKLTYLMERNLIRTFYTSLSVPNIILLWPYVHAMRALAIIKDLLRLDFSSIWARKKAMFWPLLHTKEIKKKRKIVQSKRKISDSELFKHFSEKFLLKANI